MPETRGLCLSEEQTVSSVRVDYFVPVNTLSSSMIGSLFCNIIVPFFCDQILRRPKIGAGNRITGMRTGSQKLTRRCEVTAILILYGLPRYIICTIAFLSGIFTFDFNNITSTRWDFSPSKLHLMLRL